MRYHLVLTVSVIAVVSCSSKWQEAGNDSKNREPASVADRAVSSPPAKSAAVTCEAQLIMRAGLETESASCADEIAAFAAKPAVTFACTTDDDCGIYPAAGGCLGVNAAASFHSKLKRVPESCIIPGATCEAADFSDHRTRCSEGCCEIFEQ